MWCTIALVRYNGRLREVVSVEGFSGSDLRLLASTSTSSTRSATASASATTLYLAPTTPSTTATTPGGASLTLISSLVALNLMETVIGLGGCTTSGSLQTNWSAIVS